MEMRLMVEKISYKVIVHGVVFYETDDINIAHAIAENYRTIGWTGVTVAD